MNALTLLPLILIVTTLLAAAPPLSAVAQPATPEPYPRSTLYASASNLGASLPTGTRGAVSVAAQSAVLGRGDRVIAVAVVRNGTDQPVFDLTVHIIVRDMSRNVFASSASSRIAPVALPPVGLALIPGVLDGSAAPGMVAGISVETTTPPPLPDRMDLAIRYAELRDGVLTGSVTAIHVDATYDLELLVACIGKDGTVTDYAFAPLQPRRIDSYRTIPFRIARPGGCERFLAAAIAHR